MPFAPGGSSEIVARAIHGEMAERSPEPLWTTSPDGPGDMADAGVANSTDEHTLILGHIGTLAVNPYIFPKLSYDAARDFTPLTLVSKTPRPMWCTRTCRSKT